MLSVKLNVTKFNAFLADFAQEQIPYAASRTINDLLASSKKVVMGRMEKDFIGGPVPYTKSRIQYQRSTKQLLIGFLYIGDNAEYLIRAKEGGIYKPVKQSLTIPAKGTPLSRQGNIKNKFVATRYPDDRGLAPGSKFFVGVPKNIRKAGSLSALNGLWERMGRKGKRGGKARQTLKMRAQFTPKARYVRPFWKPQSPVIRHVQDNFDDVMLKNLMIAIKSAKR